MQFKVFWKNQIFPETGCTQRLSFWSNFDPNLQPEDAQNQKQPAGYPNKSKSRPYLHSTFNENYNYFLLYLGFFQVQMGNGKVSATFSKAPY